MRHDSHAVMRLDVPVQPIRHSWYHYSCFHQVLTYAMLPTVSFAVEYVACREAIFALIPTAEYPFFHIRHHDVPDPSIGWTCWDDAADHERICEAIASGIPVIVLRDLYDVASFRHHFGCQHHPNWYLLTGFDCNRRTYVAIVEEGGRDVPRDARRYSTLELTEREVAFTGRRVARVFPVIGQFPHHPALIAEPRLALDSLDRQDQELRTALSERVRQQNLLEERTQQMERSVADLDLAAFQREENWLRVWARKLRSLQVLAACQGRYSACYEAASAAMQEIDPLLASAIFWRLKAQAGQLPRERICSKQRFLADALKRIGQAEVAIASALRL